MTWPTPARRGLHNGGAEDFSLQVSGGGAPEPVLAAPPVCPMRSRIGIP